MRARSHSIISKPRSGSCASVGTCTPRSVSDGSFIQNKFIALGAEFLTRLRLNAGTTSRLQSLYLIPIISMNTQSRLADVLTKLGCEESVEQHTPGPSSEVFLNWFRNTQLADLRMLETILRVTRFAFIHLNKPRKFTALTTLIHTLNVPQSGAAHWDILPQLSDIQAMRLFC